MTEKLLPPCFFNDSVKCPPECPLYEKNIANLRRISLYYHMELEDILQLLNDPDQAIGITYNELKHEKRSQEFLDEWIDRAYRTVDRINTSRGEYAEEYLDRPDCLHER